MEKFALKACAILALAVATAGLSSVTFAESMHNKGTVKSKVTSQKRVSDMHLISDSHINRIVTPFVDPSLKLDAVGDVKYKTSGNVVYLSTPKEMKGKIIAGFVTEKGDESNAIRFMLRPESMAPQEIHLKTDVNVSFKGSAVAKRFESSHPRTEMIMKALGDLAVGNMPSGYSLSSPSSAYMPKCAQRGLSFDFFNGQLAQGGDYVVAIGKMQNVSDKEVSMSEPSCYAEGLVAVTAYPYNTLKPGQSSEAFVMMYRDTGVKAEHKARRSLLDSD